MVAFRQSGCCRDAEPFYYDLSTGLDEAVVPQPVYEHVRQCSYCQARVRRLQEDLAPAKADLGGGQAEADSRHENRRRGA